MANHTDVYQTRATGGTRSKMQTILIPFLLAANVTQNDDSVWTNGALFKFHATLDIIGDNMNGCVIDTHAAFDIVCHTKASDSITCKTQGLPPAYVKWHPDSEFPLDVKFDKSGIKEVAISMNSRLGQRVFSKHMLTLFNIGTDLNKKKDSLPMFETMENGVLGQCNMKYTVKEEAIEKEREDAPQDKNYELFAIPIPEREAGKALVIEKFSDSIDCDKEEAYFGHYIAGSNYVPTMKSFSARMRIGDGGFFDSCLEYKVQYTAEDGGTEDNFDITETAHMELKSIEKAEEPAPEVPNPETVGIIASDIGSPQ